ncbi:MAG: ABC transporter permease, partial [Rhodothermales bacterium]
MLLNYLKIAWRNLARQKGYAFINIAGLAIGLAACILILLYVVDELGYDRYHDDADRIYRITHQELDLNGTPTLHRVLIDPPIAPLLAEEMPEIEVSARLTPVGPLLGYEDRYIQPENTYWSDPGILQILRIPFVAGEPEGALIEPFSLLLSQTQAHILFGAEDPIGKTVVVNGDESFTVRGVFADLPSNTHLKIDALGSLSTMNAWFGELGWDSPNYATYVRLARGASENAVEEKLADLLARHRPASTTGSTNLLLQPITDIHLRSQLVGEIGENGDIRYVYLLSAVAIFILLIACFNFINLSTAKAARRAREVG